MNKSTKEVLLGVALLLIAVWVPAYINSTLAEKDWRSDCLFFTGIVVGACGFLLTVKGFVDSDFD